MKNAFDLLMCVGKGGDGVGGGGVRILYHNILTHPWLSPGNQNILLEILWNGWFVTWKPNQKRKTINKMSSYMSFWGVGGERRGRGRGVKILYYNILTRPWIRTGNPKISLKIMWNRSFYMRIWKMDYHEMTSLLICFMLGGLRRGWGVKILYYNILTHPDSDLAIIWHC